MKKLLLLALLSATTLTVSTFESCKALQAVADKTCSVIINDACPALQTAIAVVQSFNISPTSVPGEILVTGTNIVQFVCTNAPSFCSEIQTALANGKTVTITPIKLSASKLKATPGVVEIKYTIH